MKTFSIVTLGCKVNQYESDAICQGLVARGFAPAENGREPDVVIINTCTVTAKAAMQSRQEIRKAVRNHPLALVAATGCHVQVGKEEVAAIKGVQLVAGQKEKEQLPEIIDEIFNRFRRGVPKKARELRVGKIEELKRLSLPEHPPKASRTRAFLKVQDGCNAFCTYCIVPYARGRSRSLPLEDVLRETERIQNLGYAEIVLTGIHLGAYGRDIGEKNGLFTLLKALSTGKGNTRFRLSSIEPMELTDDIILLVKDSRNFCSHFHIPLQSADDTILSKMGRPYRQKDVQNRIHFIKKHIPDAGIGMDILVGFPGETRKTVENTSQFVENQDISYLHVFPFSPRKGTKAFDYPKRPGPGMVKEWCRSIRETGRRKTQIFYKRFMNKTLRVLPETEEKLKHTDNIMQVKGLSDNYIPIRFSLKGQEPFPFVQVRIIGVDAKNRVSGELEKNYH